MAIGHGIIVADLTSYHHKLIDLFSDIDIHRPRSEYNAAVHRSDSREWSDDHDDAVTSAAAGGCRRLAGGICGQRGGRRCAPHQGAG